MDELTIIIRLAAATICGGLLGIERERRKRPAGLRTYILVCVGSALVVMTNIYITNVFSVSDPSRMAAQVISGIGFLGAGTIIVTTRNRVRGLTTAAGLWAAACMGIAIGAGFYLGAIVGCFLVFVTMSVLHGLDDRVMARSRLMSLYVELADAGSMSRFLKQVREHGAKVTDIEVSKVDVVSESSIALLISLRLPKKESHSDFTAVIGTMDGVCYLEEV